ncbi:hypothetical protein [Butyrivibrio sp. INlla21]|uniref:hypothetical protein n=1 Tax=Butyrivibrio sp. INlla21 TaxID=1520811 RepID=UPI0008E153B5|nr:hypothetical protein [Butyrivibrio sp. INlla21]SFU43615.1 hypothetical protein SAMN02910342_00507 [Butyrivibrio sp. INlla21]
MTDFLEITLTKSLEFRCDFKSDIYGIHGESTFYPSIRQSGIKIDTGAHGILIPLRTLCWTDAQIQKILDDAIISSRKSLSVINGVESVNNISSSQLRKESESFIKNYRGVAITVLADKIVIGDLEFVDVPVRVTPHTTGNILLGMDIIKKMDNHIGTSRETGETTLLACPEDMISEDYLNALNKHFGIMRN